jgi:hypothetical protein
MPDDPSRRTATRAAFVPAGPVPAVDAGLVLEATACTLARLFSVHRVAGPGDRAAALRALQQGLELRWRLEQELLVPALRAAWNGSCTLCDDAEIGRLRALSARLSPVADAYDERQNALVTMLETASRRRLERVAAVVEYTRRDARLDIVALGRVLMRALENWNAERGTL